MYNSLHTQFIQACCIGNTKEFNDLFSSLSIEQKNNFIAFDHFAGFHHAAANGHFEIVKAILNHVKLVTDLIPDDEAVISIFFARNGEGFKAALENQHIKTIEIILSEDYLYYDCLKIIAENPEFIRTIWDSPLRGCILFLFSQYCEEDISLVQHLLETISKESQHLLLEYPSNKYTITNNFTIHFTSPFETACYYNKLDILQFLWNSFRLSYREKVIEEQFSSCCVTAAKQGHLDIIKQLSSWLNTEQKTSFLTSIDFSAFIYAADKGYVEIVQFIWEALPILLQPAALSASNYAAYRLATKMQHPHVIAFLEANASESTIEKMKKAVTQSAIPPT